MSEQNLEEISPKVVEKDFSAGKYERVLEISEAAVRESRRFIKNDWETIHRLSAMAAFILAQSQKPQNVKMLERALQEAEAAIQIARGSWSVSDDNYCFMLGLYSQILYALEEKEKAFKFIARAIEAYPENSNIAADHAALLVNAHMFEKAIEVAQSAINLAQEQQSPNAEALAQWCLALAHKGLGRTNEAREHMQKSIDINETRLASGACAEAAIIKCIAEAKLELNKLT